MGNRRRADAAGVSAENEKTQFTCVKLTLNRRLRGDTLSNHKQLKVFSRWPDALQRSAQSYWDLQDDGASGSEPKHRAFDSSYLSTGKAPCCSHRLYRWRSVLLVLVGLNGGITLHRQHPAQLAARISIVRLQGCLCVNSSASSGSPATLEFRLRGVACCRVLPGCCSPDGNKCLQ